MEEFAQADESLIGRVIAGKFGLKRCVGTGASGAVYEADQVALGRTVAVKILRPDLAADTRFVNRFQDEALAASRLNHPNTVSVIDYGQTPEGLLYLVMEFLRGHTLTHIVRSETLEPERIADIMSQILSGLEEAHEAGVVHADLKADNIMVERRRGGWDLVKVVDFGIARLVGQPQDPQAQRTICGTPEYMAPEIIRGNEPTFATDLYAVGILLYELLAGVTPFAGPAPMEVLTRQVREAPKQPSQISDKPIDPALESIAMRAIEKAPRDRYTNATSFRDALRDGVRKREAEAAAQEVLCTACGIRSAQSFKFCPECGQPRQPLHATQEIETRPQGTRPQGKKKRQIPEGERDTVEANIALQAVAEAAGISTGRATRRFEVLELDRSVGGILPVPVVGRDDAIDKLSSFLSGATESSVLQLIGPDGSGKTRLLVDTCSQIATDATVVYISTPDPNGLAAPYYPIRAIVAGILELPPVCTYEGLGDALEGLGLSRRDLPGLAELFGYDAQLGQLEAPIRRRELLASAIRVLQAAARSSGAVLVFEDIDRYDHPSLEVVRRLAESKTSLPLRVVVSHTADLDANFPGDVEVLTIGDLSEPALMSLAAHLSGGGRTDMPDAEALGAVAQARPGHIHQLVRYIVEGGDIETAPRSIADVISARLDHLPANAKHVCQGAAVFGIEVSLEVLTATMSGRVEGTGVANAISFLEARGIITENYGVIRFDQQLIRDVIYAATPADVRRAFHRDAALVLETLTKDAAVLGHHADMAGKHRHAAELLANAGDAAVHQLDDRGACELYERALAAARTVMLADDDAANRSLFVSLSVKLADSLRAVGELALARGIVAEANAVCRDLPKLRAHLERVNAHLLAQVGDSQAALGLLREAIGTAITAGQRDLLVELYLDLAAMNLRAGQPRTAIEELTEGVDMISFGEGARAESGPAEMWQILLRLAQLHAAGNDVTEALTLGEHALRHATRTHSRVGCARSNSLLATQYEKLGNDARAEECQRQAVDGMRALGDRRGTAELILSGARPSRTLLRITPWLAREAKEMASEVGWDEGVERAKNEQTLD